MQAGPRTRGWAGAAPNVRCIHQIRRQWSKRRALPFRVVAVPPARIGCHGMTGPATAGALPANKGAKYVDGGAKG